MASTGRDMHSSAAAPLPAESPSYTLSELYIQKKDLPQYKQIDHAAKRRERETREIIEAARRVGLKEEAVRANIRSLTALLPDFAPNLDKMPASGWVKLLSDVPRVASVLIELKAAYPRANLSLIINKRPKVLLLPLGQVRQQAEQVRSLLSKVDGEGEVDAMMEAVPGLMEPPALVDCLGSLQRWFPGEDPVQVLRRNPTIMLNLNESDIAAEPTYDWTST